MNADTSAPTGADDSFEKRLLQLEEIGERMRSGEIPLAEALQIFEEGIALARSLTRELSRVERRVEILTNEPDEPDDPPRLELFPQSQNPPPE